MLRRILPLLITVFAVGTACAEEPIAAKPADAPVAAKPATAPTATKRADVPATKRATVRAARQLPPGLPHAHYTARTTVAAPKYVRRGRQLVVVEEEDPDVLF